MGLASSFEANNKVQLPNELPQWALDLKDKSSDKKNGLYHFRLREWDDREWRKRMGWHGNDLIHNPNGTGARVLDYYWSKEEKEIRGLDVNG